MIYRPKLRAATAHYGGKGSGKRDLLLTINYNQGIVQGVQDLKATDYKSSKVAFIYISEAAFKLLSNHGP